MANNKYNSTEDMINKLRELKGKTKFIFYRNISSYYDNMNIKMVEEPFAKNAQGNNKIYHEVLLLMKFLQINLEVKNMNINYHDLYYTVIKNRDEKEIVDNQYENDFNIFKNIFSNPYIGRKNDREKLS